MIRRYFFDHRPALVVVSREIEALLIPLLAEVGIIVLEVHYYRPEFVEGDAELHLTEARFAGVKNIQDHIQLCKLHTESLKNSSLPVEV